LDQAQIALLGCHRRKAAPRALDPLRQRPLISFLLDQHFWKFYLGRLLEAREFIMGSFFLSPRLGRARLPFNYVVAGVLQAELLDPAGGVELPVTRTSCKSPSS